MDITNWGDIGKSWQKDGSVENAKKIYKIMYGVFERNSKWGEKEWSMVLEDEFMKETGLKYSDLPTVSTSKRKPAGLEKLIKNVRNEANKLIKNQSAKTHGKFVTVTLKEGEKTREKDVYYPQFLKCPAQQKKPVKKGIST